MLKAILSRALIWALGQVRERQRSASNFGGQGTAAISWPSTAIREDSGRLKWETLAFLGKPEYGCDLHPIDYSAVAQACGVRGYSIIDSNQCQDVLAEAFAEQGPALIEATVDPNEPPLPPKVSFAQTRHI
jgi:hypothetical protein